MVLTQRTGPYGNPIELRILQPEEQREATLPRLRKAQRATPLPDAPGDLADEAGAVPDEA